MDKNGHQKTNGMSRWDDRNKKGEKGKEIGMGSVCADCAGTDGKVGILFHVLLSYRLFGVVVVVVAFVPTQPHPFCFFSPFSF
jgi:hypothetical protein